MDLLHLEETFPLLGEMNDLIIRDHEEIRMVIVKKLINLLYNNVAQYNVYHIVFRIKYNDSVMQMQTFYFKTLHCRLELINA